MQKILLIGGTFCPPHRAHTELANAAQEKYNFDQVIFIPCKSPVLDKLVHASIKHRLAMLRLAIKPFKCFSIDLCEIKRLTPSYMTTTLAYFRQRYGSQVSLTLLIGMDNFLQLPRWHQWDTILKRCHLLVVERPGVKPIFNLNSAVESTSKRSCTKFSRDFCHFLPQRMGDTPSTKNDKNLSNLQHINASRDDSTAEFRLYEILKKLLHEHQSTSVNNLGNSPYGTITLMNAGQYNISSTEIRSMIKEKIHSGKDTDLMISPEVRDYIKKHDLF